MNSGNLLLEAFVYLAAAVITVPLAKRLGLGSVLGYLIAGVLIGPFGLGLLGEGSEDVMHFAEFGVVMMLFVVGLELQPALLWRLRVSILGLGGLQVLGTALLVGGAAVALGLPWQQALAIGMITAMSSTAIVLQTLAEKGLMQTAGGQSAFAVLLSQDIAVIPILAVFPLLATSVVHDATGGHGSTILVAGLPPWAQTLAVLAAVAFVIVAGQFLGRPLFRAIARTRLRELFTATALLIVIGIALLMTQVGMSPALGTFLAGVVLANSEYRHELESDIEPFKGLLLGLFFIAVGATIDFRLIIEQPLLIFATLSGIMLIKFGVLFALSRLFRLGTDQGLLLAVSLAQIGEFAFVLIATAGTLGVLPNTITAPLTAIVALSMAITPILMMLNERLILPRVGTPEANPREMDQINEDNPVIIAGFGEFGSVVGRLLQANDIGTTVLDFDSDRVDILRRLGLKVYYGDALRHDLLDVAGARTARVIVIALGSAEQTLELVHVVHKHFPHLTLVARARDRGEASRLLNAGVDHVYRESLDSSLRMGVDVLSMLGMRAYQAQRAAQTFRRHDEAALRELATLHADRSTMLSVARERIANLEQILRADLQWDEELTHRDAAWDNTSLREEVVQGTFR